MSNDRFDSNRRKALRLTLGTAAAVPLAALVSSAARAAGHGAKLDESDPAAMGLQYKHDGTQAPRADKAGTKAADQWCSNCTFIQADSGDWRGCTLFPGKLVAANGWCTAWAPKT